MSPFEEVIDLPDIQGPTQNLPKEFLLDSRGSFVPSLSAPSEYKAMYLKYTDPLHLNFRLLINSETKQGFFGGMSRVIGKEPSLEDIEQINKECPNSAISYLYRIGDAMRMELWWELVNDLVDMVQNWDFLQESVEGLEEIYNADEHAAWVDGKITINFRETVLSRVQRIIDKYRHVWWDTTRGVQVLPRNLQGWDISILVYNSGYWGGKYTNDKSPEGKLLPTIQKMQKLNPIIPLSQGKVYDMIYHLFRFPSAYYLYESGTSYFSEVSNINSGDGVRTKMTFQFFGCEYSNSFKYKSDMLSNYTQTMSLASAIHDQTVLKNTISLFQKNSALTNYVDSWSDAIQESVNNIITGVTGPTLSQLSEMYNNIQSKVVSTLNKWATAPQNWLTHQSKQLGTLFGTKILSGLSNNDIWHWLTTNFGSESTSLMKEELRKNNTTLKQMSLESNTTQSTQQSQMSLESKSQLGGVSLLTENTESIQQLSLEHNTDLHNNPQEQRSNIQERYGGVRQDNIQFSQTQLNTEYNSDLHNDPIPQRSLEHNNSMNVVKEPQVITEKENVMTIQPYQNIETRKGF